MWNQSSPFRAMSCAVFVFLPFLGPHMEVPRPGVQLELQPPAYARATATWDPSCVCNLHHSSQQRRILSPLSKVRDRTHNLMVPSQILGGTHCTTMGTPLSCAVVCSHLIQEAMFLSAMICSKNCSLCFPPTCVLETCAYRTLCYTLVCYR